MAEDLTSGRLVSPFADGAFSTDMAYHVLTRRSGVSEPARAFVRWMKAEVQAAEQRVDDL
ncbi:hypothetical protein D3C81_1763230 [compost metagenome]